MFRVISYFVKILVCVQNKKYYNNEYMLLYYYTIMNIQNKGYIEWKCETVK